MKLSLVIGVLVIGLLGLSCGLSTLGVRERTASVKQPPQQPADLTRIQQESTKAEILTHAEAEAVLEPIPLKTCENGPKTVEHRDGLVQYWPTIHRRVCDGLPCQGKCISTSSATMGVWALAYTIIWNPVPQITIHGWKFVKYTNHVKCECLGCEKYTKFEECQCQDGCPGFVADKLYSDSFCNWKETNSVATNTGFPFLDAKCECCKIPRKCPENHVFSRRDCECQCLKQDCKHPKLFNQATCQCECPTVCHPDYTQDPDTCECRCNRMCPPNTVLDPVNCLCIGECNQFSGSDYCRMVHCDANTLCDIDTDGVCDCPKSEPTDCTDITDQLTCVNTICPNQPEFTCRFNSTMGCFCPCCYPRTDPSLLDCGAISPQGPAACNAVNNGNTCGWQCPL